MLLLPYRPARGTPLLLLTLAGERPLLLTGPPAPAVVAGAGAPEAALSAAVNGEVVELDEEFAPPSTMPPLPENEPKPLRVRGRDEWFDEPPPEMRPRRVPEVQIDPRTVFKQKPQAPHRAAPQKVASIPLADGPVCDMVIVPQLPSFRASEQGVKSLLAYLRTSQVLVPKAQKTAPDGAIAIELLPDVFVHLLFTEGTAPPGPPCIAEGLLWFGPKPRSLPFGPAREACLRLELVGVRARALAEGFLPKLHSLLYLKPELHMVEHDPARLRRPAPGLAAEPIPRFEVQER